jgi:hypothetical protein
VVTRLTDRIEEGPNGKPIRIKRYGVWGTTSEVESRKRKWVVVHPNKKEKEFKYLEEALKYLYDLVAGRVRE